jgi:hypothetical protein
MLGDYVDINLCFCGLMLAENVDEGQPKAAGDTGGPSPRRDEDRPLPHDGDNAAHIAAEGHDGDAACVVIEGHPDMTVSE